MIRTVGELIDALEGFDPSIPIAIKAVSECGGLGHIVQRKTSAGIPLDIVVEDVYYPEAKTVQGSDAVICLTNISAADMEIV